MTKFGESQELFEEAVEFALEMLSGKGDGTGEGWAEILEDIPVSHAVELLAAEYRDAVSKGRGMDPYEVRTMVQTILSAGTFDKNNRPFEYDSGVSPRPDDPDRRVFKYKSRVGRPRGSLLDIGLAYTVGAVMERFELIELPQRPSRNVNKPLKPSATEVVAEAQVRRKAKQPLTASGIRAILSQGGFIEEAFENGRRAGREAREEVQRNS